MADKGGAWRKRLTGVVIGSLVLAAWAMIFVGNGGMLPAAFSDVVHAFRYSVVVGVLAATAVWLKSAGAYDATASRILAALSALVGATMLTTCVLLVMNKVADDSAGVAHTAQIKKKSALSNRASYRNRTSLRNTVSVFSWLEPTKLIEVRVIGADRWDSLHPGDSIQLTAHAGRLGWPWVEPYAG